MGRVIIQKLGPAGRHQSTGSGRSSSKHWVRQVIRSAGITLDSRRTGQSRQLKRSVRTGTNTTGTNHREIAGTGNSEKPDCRGHQELDIKRWTSDGSNIGLERTSGNVLETELLSTSGTSVFQNGYCLPKWRIPRLGIESRQT